MCTVTFVPDVDGKFFLTSNRDEAPERAASNLERMNRGGAQLLFPRDQGAGGTWIGVNNRGHVLCLLNGAFERHERQLVYRMSRGIMLLELLASPDILSSLHGYDLQDIEPFTLVYAALSGLWELRWDGHTRFIRALNPEESHIWSSATLYDVTVRKQREGWFQQWKSSAAPVNLEKILNFHRFSGDGDARYDVVMNRSNIVRTVSITSIAHRGTGVAMWFQDLLSGREVQDELILLKNVPQPDRTFRL